MKHWSEHYPWRQIQTNLPEIAMEDIDAEVYVQSMKDMHATVAMINTSGIIASYKTDLPFHYQSPHLNGDQLDKIIKACHREGIRVVARTDFSKVRRPIYEQYPEWANLYPDGKGGTVIEDFTGNVHCCINSDYQKTYALDIIKETLEKLDVDGIFFNMGGYITNNYKHEYLGICQCHNCRTLFKERYGMTLPVKEDMSDPAFRKYQVFKRETMSEHRKRVVKFIKSIRPDLMIDKVTEGDFGFERCESNTEYGRALPHWQYSGSDNSKVIVTSHPHFKSSNTTVDFIGFWYRHVAVSPAQQELRLWQGLAAGAGLDYYLIGRLDNHRDRSGYEGVKRVFKFHEKHWKETYDGLTPDSKTLMVSLGGFQSNNDYRGWFRILTENHIPFNVISIGRLDKIDLSDYKALVLPNVLYLSDSAIKAVDDFVKKGGTLIADGETGFYDETYESRGESGLKSLGINRIRSIRNDMASAMLEVNDKTDMPHMADRDLVYFGDSFVYADYEESAVGTTRLIPPHWVGPPERCYWTQETELPGVIINSYGKGKALYLPWMPGRLFLREGHDNTVVFLGDLLKEKMGLESVEGNLSPMVEVTTATGADGSFRLIQLVNTSGHFGTTFYPPVSMTDLTFSFVHDRKPIRVVKLRTGEDVPFEWKDKHLTVTLDKLEFHEGLKIS
jgi:hypothetical protein